LAPGTKEDTASGREFFQDMRRRGLPDPLLVVSDGAPGIIRAIEECLPRSLRQRCLAHKMRNLQGKVPEDVWPEFKARATACFAIGEREVKAYVLNDRTRIKLRKVAASGTHRHRDLGPIHSIQIIQLVPRIREVIAKAEQPIRADHITQIAQPADFDRPCSRPAICGCSRCSKE
jgi:hypothetical protein